MEKIKQAITDALLRELSDRCKKELGVSMPTECFGIVFNPEVPHRLVESEKTPYIQIKVGDQPKGDFACFLEDEILEPLHNDLQNVNNGTFRWVARMVDDLAGELDVKDSMALDKAIQSGDFQANNWQDMIEGLNQVLSEDNKIDVKILGKGV